MCLFPCFFCRKEQVFVEEKAIKAWDRKWGFVKDYEKVINKTLNV